MRWTLELPEQKRLIGVIFDELRVLRAMPLQLPLPRDPRAARFAALAQGNLGSKNFCAHPEPAAGRSSASSAPKLP